MAEIIPKEVVEFTTSGEKAFYAFLQKGIKPDRDCVAWYSPIINNLEIDFVVFIPRIGLIVFEVKDWVLEQIVRADNNIFEIWNKGKEDSRKNPLLQAREYMYAIMEKIQSTCPQLLSRDSQYYGRVRIPLHYAVVFTNISRVDYLASGLNRVLSEKNALFSDDLAEVLAGINASSASEKIKKRLEEMFPTPFSFNCTLSDLSRLREVIWPQVHIILPKRTGYESSAETHQDFMLFDSMQESLVRRMDTKKTIIQGPAGTGKTLVLAYRAVEELKRLRKAGSRLPVLLVCFNLTLVHYLKRLLSAQHAPMGAGGIQVMSFYDLCQHILSEPLSLEKENKEYYDTAISLALDADTKIQYGAVLVDEGQDFSDDMMAVLNKVCADNAPFWIACDTAQQLYTVNQQWLDNSDFRCFWLGTSYRATKRLSDFCEHLIEHDVIARKDLINHDLFFVPPAKGGMPKFHPAKNIRDQVSLLIDRISKLYDEGVSYSEMIVLYAHTRQDEIPEKSFPEFICESFLEQGLMSSWVSMNAQNKTTWDITTDSISVSTIYSMKGLDAKAVFVLGLDRLEVWQGLEKSLPLAYVACSRARQHLEIFYSEETSLIQKMRSFKG